MSPVIRRTDTQVTLSESTIISMTGRSDIMILAMRRHSLDTEQEDGRQSPASRHSDGFQGPNRVEREKIDDRIRRAVEDAGQEEAQDLGRAIDVEIWPELDRPSLFVYAANKKCLQEVGGPPQADKNEHALGRSPQGSLGREYAKVEEQHRDLCDGDAQVVEDVEGYNELRRAD